MDARTTSGGRGGTALVVEGARALARARALLAADERADRPSPLLRTLDGQLAIANGLLRERLRGAGDSLSPAEVATTSEVIHEVHVVRFAIHDHLEHERVRRVHELERGLSSLRRVHDQDRLLDLVCEYVVRHAGFTSAVLSRIEGAEWYPWRVDGADDVAADRRTWAADHEVIHLGRPMPEVDVVRDRVPVLVPGPVSDSVFPATSFVIAPLVAGGRVVGLIHADRGSEEVDELDRDILWSFAVEFAQAFERAVLLQRLQEQRTEVMRVMRAVEEVLDDLATAEVQLATREQGTAWTASRSLAPMLGERSSELEDLLTAREWEVLSLMATGATNDRIARDLVIAEATVKSHVKHVLRKLRVENRAEAISLYLRQTIGARE